MNLPMNDVSLVVGATYFRLTYADCEQTMPGVQPLVYLGEVDATDDGRTLAFQDTVSYVRFGSQLDADAIVDEIQLVLVAHGEVGFTILSIQQVAAAVSAAADRASALGHPILPVLRKGWFPLASQ